MTLYIMEARAGDVRTYHHIIYTSDMQGLIWGEPELVQVYDFDVYHARYVSHDKMLWEFVVCSMEECNLPEFVESMIWSWQCPRC